MALIRFRSFPGALDPTSELAELHGGFFGQPDRSAIESLWAPAVDMYETQNEVVVSADLPGIEEKDIRVSITGDLLTIQGQRQAKEEVKDGGHYRREQWFGKFERTLTLPMAVETGQVKATYRDGVLSVKLPKAEEIKPKEIKIEAA